MHTAVQICIISFLTYIHPSKTALFNKHPGLHSYLNAAKYNNLLVIEQLEVKWLLMGTSVAEMKEEQVLLSEEMYSKLLAAVHREVLVE